MECNECKQVPEFYLEYINTTKETKNQCQNWMKNIPDQTPINHISIPGSHDASTFDCNRADQFCQSSQCQSLSITLQLKAGMRFLDIRVWQMEEMMVHHGPFPFHPFKLITNQLSQFMKQNSTETVILSFQAMGAPLGPQIDYPNTIRNLLKEAGIQILETTKFLTLGEMRGKVWLLGGNNIDFKSQGQQQRSSLFFFHLGNNLKIDNKPEDGIRYQNDFVIKNLESQNEFDIHKKREQARQMAFDINDPTQLKFNFLSATSRDRNIGPFPFEIAVHQKGPNKMLLEELKKRGKVNIGITIIDFPGDELIKAIIDSNNLSK